jgi:hypothetical protein
MQDKKVIDAELDLKIAPKSHYRLVVEVAHYSPFKRNEKLPGNSLGYSCRNGTQCTFSDTEGTNRSDLCGDELHFKFMRINFRMIVLSNASH